MRRLFYSIIVLMLSATVFAQAPESLNYQAVARDASGEVLTNQTVGMQISILKGSVSGIAVYTETHIDSTNQFGLLTLEIGTGTTTDDFTAIDWGIDTYFIQVEMDASGGTSYTLMGTSQLLSVPYALHSKTAANTFSGNYSDLTGTPNNVSTFTNDAGYLTSITEADPIFTAWDKTTGISITENQISDLDHFTTSDETDPVYSISLAASIIEVDTTNWNAKLDTITGSEIAFNSWDKSAGDDFSGSYNDLTDTPVLMG